MTLALTGLQQQQLSPAQLSRVAVERDGALHFEAEVEGSQRWFRFSNAYLEELCPSGDRKIPLLKNYCEDSVGQGTSLISYRPGRRVVLDRDGTRRQFIVKGFRRGGGEQAARRHEIAVAACCDGGFEVPRMLEYSPGVETLVITRHRGLVPGIGPESGRAWAAIGACLRRFQSARVTEDLQQFGASEELAVLDERARRFLLCMPALPERWQSGRELLTEAAAKLQPADPCLTHRDLHDGQFLIRREAVSLLDFDLLCKADSALDAGNLLAHISLRELQSGSLAGGASICSRAMLSGLARQDEPGFRQRLLFYQATSFYRLALLYALRPRWAHIAAVLSERGKQCIDQFNVVKLSKSWAR